LIGKDCATKYFNADATFSKERSRIRREININNYIDRLTELLSDREVVFRILCHSITINSKGMTHDKTETSVRHGCRPQGLA
jgi:hypothetical protein